MELDSKNIHYDQDDNVSEEGHILDHWLYKLACIFYASPKFGEYSSSYECKPNLRKRFQEFEAKNLLISIAACSRNNLDIMDKRSLAMAEENSPKNVGVLIKSLSEEETIEVDLTYRESCNKIIHATKVNFDYSDSDPHFGGSLNPIVHLYGEHYKYSWKAVLNIENFIESAWNHG